MPFGIYYRAKFSLSEVELQMAMYIEGFFLHKPGNAWRSIVEG